MLSNLATLGRRRGWGALDDPGFNSNPTVEETSGTNQCYTSFPCKSVQFREELLFLLLQNLYRCWFYCINVGQQFWQPSFKRLKRAGDSWIPCLFNWGAQNLMRGTLVEIESNVSVMGPPQNSGRGWNDQSFLLILFDAICTLVTVPKNLVWPNLLSSTPYLTLSLNKRPDVFLWSYVS